MLFPSLLPLRTKADGENSNILVATLQNQAETIFVDLRPNGGRWELNMEVDLDGPEPSKGGRKRFVSFHLFGLHCLNEQWGVNRETATTCRFSPKGDLIFVGSSLGSLYIFETASKSVRPLMHSYVCS